jgi:hypothetical protein
MSLLYEERSMGITRDTVKGAEGRSGKSSGIPDVVKVLTGRINDIRDAHAPVAIVTVRGIFVATIRRMAPDIFEKVAKDGSRF